MATFFRMVQAQWADSAMSGEGARRFGGRWNPAGLAAVYLAESRALAALEIMVHAPREVLSLDWRLLEVEVPDAQITAVGKLPKDWRELPWSVGAREMGGRFLELGEGLAMTVPSVVVPEERNLLVNPMHPEIHSLRVSKPRVFSFDPRV